MKQYSREGLNIKRLLALGDLNIAGIAKKNGTLPANSYFSKVEQFIEDAPKLAEALQSVSRLEETIKALKDMEARLGVSERSLDFAKDTDILKDLEKTKSVLTEIGYEKLNLDIDNICTALKSGEMKMAEKIGRGAIENFNALYGRTKSAYAAKRFPVATSEDEAEDEQYSEVSLAEALEYFDYEEETRKLRVLAVDDVTVVLNTITSVLSPYYDVFALKSSTQVEKFLTLNTPELFLLDIEMNEMNGFDLVPLIRQFEEHKDTPIIFLTGNASYSNLKGAVALGACDFITKPVKQDVLLEKISKNIVRKKAY